MPNPHPSRRVSTRPIVLPPGIRLRADGRHELRYTDRDGRRRTIATTAGRSLEDLVALTGRGVERTIPARIDRRLTVAAYLRLWILGLELAPNTVQTYRENVERYLVPGFGERLRLVDLSADHVRALYADLRRRPGRPLAPRTLGIAHATLRKALGQAVTDERIPANPAIGIDPTAGRRARQVGDELPIPTLEEQRRLEAHLRGDRLHALYLVAVLTGLRQSEALGLRAADIDLEARRLHVRRSLRRTDRQLAEPKTAASRRSVRFAAYLADALRARLLEQKRERLAAGDRWSNPEELIFTTPAGAPLVGAEVTRWMQAALAELRLPRYRWHDLRHAYATGMLEEGRDLAEVSKALGHSSLTVTADVYLHLTDRMADEMAAIAGRRITGRG